MMKCRLASISLEGFRAFAKEQTIVFAPQLTVIYGKNGCGKTSLIDALSWLFNGDIPRYETYGSEWSRHRSSHTRSLFHPETKPAVRCVFESLPDRQLLPLARIGGSGVDGDPAIRAWCATRTSRKTGTGNDLLRAHILQQATMLRLAAAKGSDRLSELAPLLDLADTAAKISEYSSSVRALTDGKRVLEKELESTPSEDASIPVLRGLCASAKDIVAHLMPLGVTVAEIPGTAVDTDDWIRDWSAWIEQSLDDIVQRIEVSTTLANDMRASHDLPPAQHPGPLADPSSVEKLKQEVTRLRDDVERTLREAKATSSLLMITRPVMQALDDAIRRYSEANSELTRARSDVEACEGIRKSIEQSTIRESELLNELADADVRSRMYQLQVDDLKQTRNSAKSLIEQLMGLYSRKRQQEALIGESGKWLAEHSEELRSSQVLQAKLELEHSQLSRESALILEFMEDSREARRLLDKHARTQECPLCGHFYETCEELYKAIDAQTKRCDERFRKLSQGINATSLALSHFRQLKSDEARHTAQTHEQAAVLLQTAADIRTAGEALEAQLGELGTWNHECTSLLAERDWDGLRRHVDHSISIMVANIASNLEAEANKRIRSEQELQGVKTMVSAGRAQIAKAIERLSECQAALATSCESLDRLLAAAQELVPGEHVVERNAGGVLDAVRQRVGVLENELKAIERSLDDKMKSESDAKLALTHALDAQCAQLKAGLSRLRGLKASLNEAVTLSGSIGRRKAAQDSIREVDEQIRLAKSNLNRWRRRLRMETDEAVGSIAHRVSAAFAYLSESSLWDGVVADPVEPDGRERPGLIFHLLAKQLSRVSCCVEMGSLNESNATFALSQGQLSVLGLSIFLAIFADPVHRKVADGPIFDTLILDDPVQSLDSLRDDALASLLSDMARTNQVIVASSDARFVSQIMLSSRVLWNANASSCRVVELRDMTELGPTVVQHKPQDWVRRQRIYLPELA